MNPASTDILLSVDDTSTVNNNNILKQELFQTKKQLVDA
jgi:hypothetical protein